MTEVPQKSDLQILLGELDELRQKTIQAGNFNPEFELAILKIKSELVRLHQEAAQHNRESVDRIETHNREITYQYKGIKYQQREATWRSKLDLQSKMITEAVGFAKIAINSLVIVSAGAVLAILAFLGNVFKAGCKLGNIIFIQYFEGALAFAILTAGISYISQILFAEQRKPKLIKLAGIFRIIGIMLAFTSFALFICASLSAYDKFWLNEVIVCPKEHPAIRE